ncbi:hypothetical protein JG687_00007796 [Phytophthora cactorum]|uniref:Tautomerase/MIF superfamily n=1 Tax=Phytophthora cactorum TaxID=29920 RepID=A0A329RBJ0_9STRA|nr:hypothetical protein PC113_g14225 [Phytophthora cactorum]KAG3153784.1 hypothetical protein C6341_g15858 [Phytophthora cactorum]KAG3178018.1 hypothetical protein PC128_g16625 [Phytophthora cactorum]KAG6961208.1 hypothetical protein JG687_00007796 [Phytophthora cactorum]RAW20802.1 hypothetical protein PC110_g22755 [Phytophthora cactorum]
MFRTISNFKLVVYRQPMVFIHIHSIGRLEDERNPKTVAALTETVAEELRYHLCV